MRKLLTLALIIMSLSVAVVVRADGEFTPGSAVKTTQTVTALWGPGTDYGERFSIPEGQFATICGPHLTLGTNHTNGYVRIRYRGVIGWVPAPQLTVERVGPATGRSWNTYHSPESYRTPGICPGEAARYHCVW